jgi:hypothetical protein
MLLNERLQQLLFTPPYNPIEMVFGVAKAK